MKKIGVVMKSFLLAVSLLLVSAPSFAGSVFTCSVPDQSGAPMHWGAFRLVIEPSAIQLTLLQGNPQEVGAVGDFQFVKDVFPQGHKVSMFHGLWRNPQQAGIKASTFYVNFMASGAPILTYISEMTPFYWSCR